MKEATVSENIVLAAYQDERYSADIEFSGLNSDHFNGPRRAIFEAIQNCYREDRPVCLAPVGQSWTDEWLMIGDHSGEVSNWDYHVKELKRSYNARKRHLIALEIARMEKEGQDTTRLIESLSDESQEFLAESLDMSQMAHLTVKYLEAPDAKILTGLGVIDNRSPIYHGDFAVIGARPSTGKTSFLMQILSNLKDEEGNALQSYFFSLDTHPSRLGIRFLKQAARGAKAYNQGHIDKMSELPITVCQNPTVDIDKMEGILRAHKRKNPDLSVVAIDHIGKIAANGYKSLYEKTTHISDRIMQWVRKYDVTVIALSQLNRQINSEDRAVSMGDFRDSGAIEQDASIMFGMWLGADSKQEKSIGSSRYPVSFNCLKNKDGETNKFDLMFDGPSYTFWPFSDK